VLIWVILGIVALYIVLIFLISVSQYADAQILTDHNFTIYYNDPNSHIGQYTILTGKIFNILPSSEGYNGFQMYLSGDNKKNVAVFYNASEVPNESSEDDCVRVKGTTTEKVNSQNAFGAELSIPGINAVSLKKISCLELVDPEAKIVPVNRIQNEGGIIVTLHKIELTNKETRVFLTIENTNKDGDIHFYPSDSLVTVGNKQYETKYSATYPSIRSTIPEGIREDGAVVFEPVDHKDGKFRFKISKGFSEDYPFIFDVPLSKADWNQYVNSTLGLGVEYPVNWKLNTTDNSMCNPVTGTCFTIKSNYSSGGEEGFASRKATLLELSRNLQEANVNESLGDKLIKPTQISNYTIDGKVAGEFSRRVKLSQMNMTMDQQNIVVIHNSNFFVLSFTGYTPDMSKAETKQILGHIIKSIRWSEPIPNKYYNSSSGIIFGSPFYWQINSSKPEVCDSISGSCFDTRTGNILNVSRAIRWSEPNRNSVVISSMESSKPTPTSASKPEILTHSQTNSSKTGSPDGLSSVLANAQKSLNAKTPKK
jgi:hypothetical protein